MARLCLMPAKDVLATLFLGNAPSSSSSVLLHGRNPRSGKQEGNQQQLAVRCCEKSTPMKKKRVRIPSKRIKTEQPWWNVIFRKEEDGREWSGASASSAKEAKDVAAKAQLKIPVEDPRDTRVEHKKVIEEVAANRPATSQAPLLEAIRKCAAQDTAAFHFPGHHCGAGAPPALVDAVGSAVFAHDLPELPELDSLFAPATVIAEAQKKAALAFGADATYFLVNGTTCGIQAAVMATCKPGDILILPRNCHLSAISAMVLSGALPWYVIPNYDANWGVAHGVSGDAVEVAISQVRTMGGRVGAVLVVSPTYYGVCSPLGEIAKTCRENEVPLIVDEAHGAHFRFHEDLPDSALEQGADIAVQSTHKVLGALTQSSMLHVRRGARVDRELLLRCLQMVQSSSPSYLLLSSLDAARAQMSTAAIDDDDDDNAVFSSSAILGPAIDLAVVARECLREIPNLMVMDEGTIQSSGDSIPCLDPLRITVGLWRLTIDGYEADDVLRGKFGVVAELPGIHTITFAVNTGTTARDIARLVEALRALSLWFSKDDNYITMEETANPLRGDRDLINPLLELPSSTPLSPRDAFFCKTMKVDAEAAVGQISAELLCPYPPGIPVITPGEIISENAVAYLRSILAKGGTISGSSDPCLKSMFICQR